MDFKQINSLITKLKKDYQLHAPQKEEELYIKEVEDTKDIDWSGEMPINTWKALFLPPKEVLEEKQSFKPTVALGVHILDLRALILFDHSFEKDVYYQKRRRNILVVGYSKGIPDDYQKYKVFSHDYEEHILEHVRFDIFIEKGKDGKFKVFSGSRIGQDILESLEIKDYEHIEFAGAVAEEGPDKKMLEIRKKFDKFVENKMWEELGEKCLACGKCTIACPTCFCFDVNEETGLEAPRKERVWGSCFYDDFSRIAGAPEGYRFLDSIKDRIYFWYEHKFLRIPDEYSIPGCVGCNRCTKVCPVGIDIQKNIKRILKS